MSRVKKRIKKKKYKVILIFTLFIFVIVVFLSYLIFYTDFLKPKIDMLTYNYISFNNKENDLLMINNISKMSDNKGESNKNNSNITLNIDGKKNSKYKIVLYSYGNIIDYKYINLVLDKNNTRVLNNKLNTFNIDNDNGIVIYEDKIDDDNIINIKLWVSKDFNKNPNNTSFVVKIKSR